MWEGILLDVLKQIKPLLSIFLGAVCFVFILKLFTIFLRKRRRYKYSRSTTNVIYKPNNLDILSKADFTKSPLLNKSEALLCSELSHFLESKHQQQSFKLFSQVSMGEFIQSKNVMAFNLINRKRVDFLIVDQQYNPVVVIEYQGSGHYQNNAVERDAIKKECCRKANIEYIEFKQNHDELDFQRVSKILNETYQI
ncbi:adenylosuccinate synthetase [Pasteurellaceae bacterium Orientalotternb1]|nr:adenylosuccinate synthetase [Pasteurellaceae bacterium Orientalotternb1]